MTGIYGAILVLWIPFFFYGKRLRVFVHHWKYLQWVKWDDDWESGEYYVYILIIMNTISLRILNLVPIQVEWQLCPLPLVVDTRYNYVNCSDRRGFLAGLPPISKCPHNFSQRGQTIMTSETVYPSSGLDDRIPSFLTHFYSTSDNEHGKEGYPDFFTRDASFTFIAIKMTGHEGIPHHLLAVETRY
jgi:hypothetical protein